MLADKPTTRPYSTLNYILKLATSNTKYFTLHAAQKLSFVEFYCLDVLATIGVFVVILSCDT